MNYKKAIQNLKKDKILAAIIAKSVKEIKPSLEFDIYHFLLESIVSQQLSIKVADIIFNRFLDLFSERYPDPKALLSTEDDVLRSVGLSYRKASYLKNVAEFTLNNNMEFEFLQQKTDNEIIDYLVTIKGVGKWTVQMILMFPMDRPDIFPVDDLGIQNNMKAIYGLTLEKKELKTAIITISENWKPYRTLASKYIWNWKNKVK